MADSLSFISGTKRYSEILYPKQEDARPPEEIARERAEKLGIKVV